MPINITTLVRSQYLTRASGSRLLAASEFRRISHASLVVLVALPICSRFHGTAKETTLGHPPG